MTVTLSKEAESYVNQLSAGTADDASNLEYLPPTEAGLIQKLLEGVRAPHRTYEPGELCRNAERLTAERQAS